MKIEDMVRAAVISGQAAYQKAHGELPNCTWLAELGAPAGNEVRLATIVVLHPGLTVEDFYLEAVAESDDRTERKPVTRQLLAALAAFQAVISALEPLRCRWLAADKASATGGCVASNVVELRRQHH